MTPGTVAAAIFTPERRMSGLPAFIGTDDRGLTYGDAASITGAIAATLASHGGTGGRIAFTAPRGPMGVLGFLAASSLGTCCPLNPRLRTEEMAASLRTMEIGLLMDASSEPGAAAAARTLGIPVVRVSLDEAGERPSGPVPRAPGEMPAMLMATSGTTSAPKLVPLSHANILAAAGAIRDAFALGPVDLCLNPMPLHHVHGLVSAALSSLLSGSAVCCTDGFDPAGFDAAFRALQPTWFTASPAMHLALREFHEHAGTRPAPGRLRFFRSSSAPLPQSAIAALEALFEAPLIETYGLTETASMVCSNPLPPAIRKPGSVGIAFGSEIRVLAGPTEVGEVAVRGPSVITAYVDGAAAGSFEDGWLLTGDIGRLDQDGYLFLVGRAKEVIKRGGLSVYPAEVDDALAADPAVAEAVTFAVPHPTLGEDVVAAVVVRAGAAADTAGLRAGVAARLSTYKVPSVVLVVPAIPKNETGKVVRRQLAAALAADLAPRRVEPADAAEQALLATWRRVLGRDDIGVTDNLFLFGADPLRAGRAAEMMPAPAPTLKDMLAAPTVREQARLVAAR